MIDLYLVRHWESEANALWILAWHTDVPLSEKWKAQAEALTQFLLDQNLEIDVIYSSPLVRAYDTISPYAASQNLEPITDERLKEKYLWVHEYRPVSELFTDGFHADPYTYNEPNWYESYEQCVVRVRWFLDDKIFNQKDSKILISSHAGLTRAIIAVLKDLTHEISFLRIQNASFTHYRIDETTLKAECIQFAYDMYLREANMI